MKLEFFGAARSVTGSCHMLSFAGGKLLVDCGMRQGADAKGVYGEASFPFQPSEIGAVVLTHAHIDHSGLLPLLVKRGFTGTILCTEATAELSTIMLPDSAHIQMQEAEWQTRKNLRAGKQPVEPLYNLEDVQNTLKLYRGVDYEEMIQLFPNVRVRLRDIGHLLGSAAAEIWAEENEKTTKFVFSGDVGRNDRPILNDPEDIDSADYLIMEGTYGNRNHEISEDTDKERELADAVRTALARGGNLVIPSFAVGRTQELLYYLKRLLKKGVVHGLESVPVYIDSPLGIEATKVYEHCAKDYFDAEALEMAKDGSPFDFPTLRVAQTAEESRMINDLPGSKIIISASGMCEAGRIRHHLKHNLYRADSTILFVGYQAEGTMGRALLEGAKHVKLFGEDVRVNAAITKIEGFSGHAGKDELIDWATAITPKPKRVFLVHGEEESLYTLAQSLTDLGYTTMVPSMGDVFDIAEGQTQPAMPAQKVVDIQTKARGYQIQQQLERLQAIFARSGARRSPDMELKLSLLEADVRSLAEKWDALI